MKINNVISYIPPQSLANCQENAAVLLAFSGGADSSVLLHLLLNDSKEKGYTLHIAHFHHGIRGEEADRDAAFCESIAKKYGLPFYLGKADVPSLAKENGNSIEAEARAQRYAFFENIMRENEILILATAHHAEDQTESILLHILRGSGIGGLKGIRKCRPFAENFYIVRPLLDAKKQDILDYCHQNNIEFVTDSTNFDTNYLRNAIRTNVIPELCKLQPNLAEIFQRLSENAAETDDFINASAIDFIEKECNNNIPLEKFNSLPQALKSRVISIAFEKKSKATLERVHIDDVISLCKKGRAHSSISLPNKISAKIENSTLVFIYDEKSEDFFDFILDFFEGERRIFDHTIITVEKNPVKDKSIDQIYIDIKCDLLKNACFRSRKEGDVIFTDKMNKKVKKLMSEKKIPLDMRKKVPILVSNDEILWIPTVAVCDRVKFNKIKNEDFYRISIKFVN